MVEVLGWASSCSGSRLLSVQPSQAAENKVEEFYLDLFKVLEEYHDLKELLSKCKATVSQYTLVAI